MNKQETMSMLNCSVDDNLNISSNSATASSYYSDGLITSGSIYSCWDYWHHDYYPIVIRESYPVYFQERAIDRGKKAFEIIKILKDKKLVCLKKVSDFIDLMDELIKIL